MDIEVLKSLDLEVWRPRLIAIEAHGMAERAAIESYLQRYEYTLRANILITLVFEANPVAAGLTASRNARLH